MRLSGHHDHRGGDAGGLDLLQQGQAVHLGHDHVREDQVELLILDHLQGFYRIVTDRGFMPGKTEGAGERRQRVGVIVDDEEVSFHGLSNSPG